MALFICVKLIFVRTRNFVFQCRDTHYLVVTELLHTVSQQAFQVAIISVATGEDSVAIESCLHLT